MLKRLLAFIAVGLALCAPAHALMGAQRTVYMQPPGWVLDKGSTIVGHMDLVNHRYWFRGVGLVSLVSQIGLTRTSQAWAPFSTKIWAPFDSNVHRITDLGFLPENTATNYALWSRNLTITTVLTVSGTTGTFTNGETVTATGGGTGVYVSAESAVGVFALSGGSGTFTGTLTGGTSGATTTIGTAATVWVAASVTVAQTATGIDGVSNSAATLTASGANGTVLQSMTIASAASTGSFFVKRRTGSGTVSLTIDNSTFTTLDNTTCRDPVTKVLGALSSTQYMQCSFEATLANPILGLKIVTSGDAVDVDFGQLEAQFTPTTGAGSPASSPILTTNSASVRNIDNATYIGQLARVLNNPATNPGSLFVQTGPAPVGQTDAARGVIDAQSVNHPLVDGTTTTTIRSILGNASATATIGGSGTLAGNIKAAVGWDSTGKSAVANLGTVATNGTAPTSTTSIPNIGNQNLGSFSNKSINNIANWKGRLPDGALKSFTICPC